MAKFTWYTEPETPVANEAEEVTDYTDDNDEEIDFENQTISTRIVVDDNKKALTLDDIMQLNNSIQEKNNLESFEQVFTSSEPPIKKEEVTFAVETTPEQAEKVHQTEMAIGNRLVEVQQTLKEAAQEVKDTSDKAERIREYKKNAEMPKIVHAKASTGANPLIKLGFFLVACIAVGVFFGIKANSYYVYSGKSSAFGWLTVENLPYVFSPIYSDVFMTGFLAGAGILGVIGLFTYLDNDTKKASRVGHEHGQAHLAKAADHKTYTNRFMER